MDPLSALGAASSVVGVASFGLQLSQVLYKFTSQALSAPEGLQGIVSGIHATHCALEQVHGILAEECENLKRNGRAILFSTKAIDDVKGTADKCLLIFWRIEATITNKSGSKFEDELIKRLNTFNQALSTTTCSNPIRVDNALVSLTTWGRLRWPLIAPKLDNYNKQLQILQMNLVLMFSVVSLHAHRLRPTLRAEDFRALAVEYDKIRRMAAQPEFSQIAPNFGQLRQDSFRRNPPKNRNHLRLESPAPLGDTLRADNLPWGSKRQHARPLTTKPQKEQEEDGPEVRGRSPPGRRTTDPSRQATVDDVSEEPDEQAGKPTASAPPTADQKGKGKEEDQEAFTVETIFTESRTEGSPMPLPQPQSQRQPSWMDPSYAKNLVDTTVPQPSTPDQQPVESALNGQEPSPAKDATIPLSRPKAGPSLLPDYPENYGGGLSAQRRDSEFYTRERYIPLRNPDLLGRSDSWREYDRPGQTSYNEAGFASDQYAGYAPSSLKGRVPGSGFSNDHPFSPRRQSEARPGLSYTTPSAGPSPVIHTDRPKMPLRTDYQSYTESLGAERFGRPIERVIERRPPIRYEDDLGYSVPLQGEDRAIIDRGRLRSASYERLPSYRSPFAPLPRRRYPDYGDSVGSGW